VDKNISNIIVETCKKENIPYKSCNPNYVTFNSDAQLLGQLYRDLIEIGAKLSEIAERHDIPLLREMIKFDIEQLEAIDHDLVRMSNKLKEENA